MEVGHLMFFQCHPDLKMTDAEIYLNELAVADMTEPLGFDSIWCTEHHFTDYVLSPNIIEFLSYMAGRTTTLKLGTAAVILPWHKDPLRVATDFAMLDNLSGGRAMAGFGRGLAQVEYDGFGISMDESRDRMNQSAMLITEALDTGFMESSSGHFIQERREIRPRPLRTFRDRTFVVSMSPDTVPHAAKIGGALMTFAIGPWEKRKPDIDLWREKFEEEWKRPAPNSVANVICYVDEDAGKAKEMAHKYMGRYWISAMNHYEMKGDHFSGKGGGEYDHYAKSAEALKHIGDEGMAKMFTDCQIYGTPEQVLEMVKGIEDLVGNIDVNVTFSYSGMPYDMAKKNIQLFGEKVLPVLKNDWAGVKAG
ncbi:MAG: LLM class flavin-dependent oxidoreductase [Gammaproteobacteria bacterium]|nr:LLM class flavin-dependent oxidoreductase [Gammaproteobacteria bacterium]MBQ0840758.1 LLM class flavin-dependent oxidoreductase [Gammaproteobacteria bacterium]